MGPGPPHGEGDAESPRMVWKGSRMSLQGWERGEVLWGPCRGPRGPLTVMRREVGGPHPWDALTCALFPMP